LNVLLVELEGIPQLGWQWKPINILAWHLLSINIDNKEIILITEQVIIEKLGVDLQSLATAKEHKHSNQVSLKPS
jgi:hypothetical protein